MLWRSAPEANSTVAPRRSAAGWQPMATDSTTDRARMQRGTAKSNHGWRDEPGPGRLQTMPLLVRRAVSGLGVVLGVVTLMFALLRLAPGDPAMLLVGPAATAEQLAAQRHSLGLDRPLTEQYVAWLGRFARGDWGTSISTGRPVRAMLGQAWPATVRLVGISLVLSYLIGIAIGVVQAARRGRVDTALSIATVTLFALPGYWLGLMLVMVFTYRLRWLPAFGAAGFDADFLPPAARLADRLRHLVLPLATLTLVGIGGTARFVRGAVLDVAGGAGGVGGGGERKVGGGGGAGARAPHPPGPPLPPPRP